MWIYKSVFLVGGERHRGGIASHEGDVQEVEQAAVSRHAVEAKHVWHGHVDRQSRDPPDALGVPAPAAGRLRQVGVAHRGGETPGWAAAAAAALPVEGGGVAARMDAREEELEAVCGPVSQRLDGLLGVGHAELGVVERGRGPEEMEHAEFVRVRAVGFGAGGDLEPVGGGGAVGDLQHDGMVLMSEQLLMLLMMG